MAKEIGNWVEAAANDFYVLVPPGENASQHNVYVEGHGYLIDHLGDMHRRNSPDHWNAQFENAEAFRESWKPRQGPLALIDALIAQRLEQGSAEPLVILNMGAGLGDFTVDLARRQNVKVVHVDFSERANQVAQQNVDNAGVNVRVQIITAENGDFLRKFKAEGRQADVIFFYGGLVENTPLEADIEKTFASGVEALADGGYMWVVALEQPFLLGLGDRTATDIPGEFPHRPWLVYDMVAKQPGMNLVREERGERPDKHPLKPGKEPQDHMHIVYRGLFVKAETPKSIVTPSFSFK